MSRRAASVLAWLGLVTATFGYVVLTGTSATAEAALRGDIGRAWATPFDLLIRPESSIAALERSAGLIRPNYLESSGGGITIGQLQKIRDVPGVDVAAPIAMVGVDAAPGLQPLFDLSDYRSLPHRGDVQVFRITRAARADAGRTSFELPTLYAVVVGDPDRMWLTFQPLTIHGSTLDCRYPVFCFSGSPPTGASAPPLDRPMALAASGTMLVIAGVDPVAEARLAGLDGCTQSGRPLSSSDSVTARDGPRGRYLAVPVEASARSYVDETDTVRVDVADDASAILSGARLPSLAWRAVDSVTTTADEQYRKIIAGLSGVQGASTPGIVSIGDVSYSTVGADHLLATEQPSNPRAFPFGSDRLSTEAGDTWFRSAQLHPAMTDASKGKAWDLVGTFNPDCLAAKNQFAGGGLDAYADPRVALPSGGNLAPNPPLTGYVGSPPMLLTTLDGARALTDPTLFAGQPGVAFIGVVRVKVRGVERLTSDSAARLARVAAEIHDATGLHVDVMKGASPRTVRVDLPAGKYGRPSITVTEEWSVVGVALAFSRAVSAQNLALFTVILLASAGLVGQTAYMSVRTRRSELGLLRAVGWPAWRLATLVQAETLVLAAAAGLAALVLSALVSLALRLQLDPRQSLATVPVAVGLASVAAGIPTLIAARAGRSADRVARRGSFVRPSGIRGPIPLLGLRDMLSGWRVEALVGAASIALSSGLVALLVMIEVGFRGQLDATVLGADLVTRVQPFHAILAIVTVAVAVCGASEVLLLAYLERRLHLATLRALGWPPWALVQFLCGQAIGMAVLGAMVSAAFALACGLIVGAGLGISVLGATASVIVAAVAGSAALIMPVWMSARLSLRDHPRAE